MHNPTWSFLLSLNLVDGSESCYVSFLKWSHCNLAKSKKILVDVFVVYSMNLYLLVFCFHIAFLSYCSKDTLNIRNSQTFLVVFEIYNQMLRLHNNNPTKHHLWKCVWWNCKKQKSRPGSLCKWEAWWKLSPQRYVYFFETAKLLRINLCKILVF